MKYKIILFLKSDSSEVLMYQTNNYFEAFNEYLRLKIEYPSLNFQLYIKI